MQPCKTVNQPYSDASPTVSVLWVDKLSDLRLLSKLKCNSLFYMTGTIYRSLTMYPIQLLAGEINVWADVAKSKK